MSLQRVSPGQPTQPHEVWQEGILRVYFQNINGFRLSDDGADVSHTLAHMYNIKASIFAFNETKANCVDPAVRHIFDRCKNQLWERRDEQCKLFTCSSDMAWRTKSKPGGLLMGVTGPLVGRTKQHFKDKYGRWLRADFLGRNGCTVSVICAYQVSQERGSHGPNTTYAQRVRLMRMDGVDNPDPRKQFITDLAILVGQLKKAQHDIILMGDFNESIGDKPDMMAKVVSAGGLTDSHIYLHGLDTEKPTYSRGNRRLDYILVSSRLIEFLHRSGAEPFNFRIFSDHRGIWADFSLPGFFDRAPNILAKLPTRNLIYDVPRHAQIYLEKTRKYYLDHDVPHRIGQLLSDDRDDAAAEGLDNDITRAMLSAELALKSTPREPWSQELHTAMTTVYILLRHLSQLRTKIDMSESIALMQSTLSTPVELPATITATNKAAKAARRQKCLLLRTAKDLAKARQAQKIQARQLANPEASPDQIAHQFHRDQAARDLYKAVPSAKPGRSGGISTVEVPVDPTADPKAKDTIFHRIVEPKEVEEHIQRRNQKHFSQARDAPLAAPNVLHLLGFSGISSVSDQLLLGTADINSITPDRFGRALLRHCRRVLPEASPMVTLAEFKESYKNWPVGTSTSPSGRHLSHQHVLFQAHGVPKDEGDLYQDLEESRELNWEVQVGIVQYATKYGYCFRRWQQVVNAMLEKETGNPKLHRLRVIHLYESDYNGLLGMKLRHMMHQCEDYDTLHPGAYGSRANRQSLDPVFLEVLQYDYAALTRWPEIKFGNDTSSCYDRHIPPVNNIICRAMGLHRNIAQIHGNMLEHAQYRIKTQLGISANSYSHSSDSPVFGTGQGSKASPPIWSTLCNLLFRIYDESCWGAHYYDMSGSHHLKLGMTGFVDDNACNVNCLPQDRAHLIQRSTLDTQLWNDVLWGGGQILEPPKCCYHRLETDFTSSGTPFFIAGRFGDPIVIKDSNGVQVKLKQLCAYEAYKTLGTWQAIGDRQDKQFQELRKKSRNLSRVLALSSCSGNAAWLYFSSIFQKGIGYPLAVARLSKSQLHALEGPMISLTLNRMRYTKRLARALVHGPRFYGGLEFNSFISMQGSSKLNLLIRHLRCPGQPQQLAMIVIDRFQFMAGVGYPILQDASTHLPHLEGVWIPTVREYLRSIRGSLDIADITIQPLVREGDKYIMEMVMALRKFTITEIKRLNYCRLYLRVLTLADLCNATGTALAPGIAMGVRSAQQSQSSLLDPLQERPGDHVWGIWRRFLRTFSYGNGKLFSSLGPWPSVRPARRLFPSLYSPTRDIVYRSHLQEYSVHRRVRTRVFAHYSTDYTDDLPEDCTPVDLTDLEDGWRISIPCVAPPAVPTDIPVHTFREYLSALPDHQACLFDHVDLLGNDIFDICDAFKHLDNIVLVSDGGAHAMYGSFGWVVSQSDGKRLAQGSGSAFGRDPRSYRAENYGAKAGALFIYHVFEYCERPLLNSTFEFYCDNQGVLKKLTKFRSYKNAVNGACLHSEWDMVSSVHRVHQLFAELPLLDHVKGHQDANTMKCMLPLPAQLNIEADELASAALSARGSIKSMVLFDPSTRTMLHIRGVTVTRNLEATIRLQNHIGPIRQYYRDRFHWSVDTLDAIDWETHYVVYKKYARTRTFFSKFGWKKLPIGNRLHERSPAYDHRCPCCHQDFENDDHVFQCSNAFHVDWRRNLIQGVINKFGAFLDPDLLAIIRLGLNAYFTATIATFDERFPTGYSSTPYQQLISEQTSIGWDHFLRGKMSGQWQELQFYYAKRYNLLKASEGWLVALVRLFTTSSFTLWDFRNGCRHGRDSATRFQKTYEQAKREVRALYLQRDHVLPHDREIFWDSVDLHVQEPLTPLQSWLQTNTDLINFSVRQAKAKAKKQTKTLSRYFRRTRYSVSRRRRRPNPISPHAPQSPQQGRLYKDSYMTSHFRSSRSSISVLPPIPEYPHAPSCLTALRAPGSALRASRPRQRYLADFFPDAPT